MSPTTRVMIAPTVRHATRNSSAVAVLDAAGHPGCISFEEHLDRTKVETAPPPPAATLVIARRPPATAA